MDLAKIYRPPFWHWGLANWHWKTADGTQQGLHNLTEQPGLANLLWLALNRIAPPGDGYDWRRYPLIIRTFAACRAVIIAGVGREAVTLEEWCATHTLQEFAALKSSDPWLSMMISLAKGRLGDADA